jgi:5-formyltetrahydrofolate cyclo-ligase
VKDFADLDKKKLRSRFLQERRAMPQSLRASKSATIFEAVKTLPIYQKAEIIMFYSSFDGETETDKIIKDVLKSGKTAAMAAIKDKEKKEMGAFKITSLNFYADTVMGIKQPKLENEAEISKSEIDLFFIPGIVFDLDCFRIGYGGGFFDKYLKGIPQGKTAGLCYDFQIIDRVPREVFDAQLGVIISEKRILQENLTIKAIS